LQIAVRQQGAAEGRRSRHVHVALASLLAFLLLAVAAPPATSAPQRVTSIERYAHKLVNCIRTGGRISHAGQCVGYGSGKYSKYRPPLAFSHKISNKVAWPWAQRTAQANVCGHSLAGSTVDRRFAIVRLRDDTVGENIGCSSAWSPKRMVVTMIRWWTAERAYNGWHWRQIKDRSFKSAGYGFAKLGNGRTRLVVNFYGKPVD
jgi:hypothetical protein